MIGEKTSKEELLQIAKKYQMYSWDHLPIIFVEGKGTRIKDIDGKEYIDCTSQAWTLNVGHQHPRVIKSVKEQIDKMVFAFGLYFEHIPKLDLLKKLADISPGNLKKVLFAVTGSEAMEAAMQLSMKYKKAQNIIAFYHGYHGRTFATIAASLAAPTFVKLQHSLEKFMNGMIKVPNWYCYRCYFKMTYPDCGLICADFVESAIRNAGSERIAGVMLEPIQAQGGHIDPPKEYLPKIREICDTYDVPLIFDEIQTGFGRTGKMFACEYYNTMPDFLVIGKGLSAGFPLSAVLTSDKFNLFESGDFGFTHAAHPLSCAAAISVIDIIRDEKLLDNSARMGAVLSKGLKEMEERYEMIGDVRCPGLFIGVEFVEDKKSKKPATEKTKKFLSECIRRGVLFGRSGVGEFGNVVKIKPPLNISREEVDKVLEVFEGSLKAIT